MLCAISGEAPQQPVASRRSGNTFERRLIESYISEHGTDPVTGETLTLDDLLDIKTARAVRPRPPQLTSIPALLSTFQNEWDAVILETFELKQQLAEVRQELSTALYYNDSAQRVVARLQRERDEARDALARVTMTSADGLANGANGDAMQVDGQSLPKDVITKIDETQAKLQGSRRKRPVPEDWATAEQVESYEVKQTADSQFTGAKILAVDHTGDFFFCGDSDGEIGVYDLKQNAFTTRSNISAGAVLGGAWAHDKTVVSTSSGAVVVAQGGSVVQKFSQHAGAATAVAVHPCGELVASVGEDQSYVLYDLEKGKVLTQIFTDAGLTTIAFHPDGHLLATGTASGSIKLFDVKSAQTLHTFPAQPGSTAVQALMFSENGTWLASANLNSGSVNVWDLRKTALLKSLDMGSGVQGLAWDYTGQYLAACGSGGVVVSRYDKKAKGWDEPLRKAVGGGAVDVAWGARAAGLVVLTAEGGVSVLSV